MSHWISVAVQTPAHSAVGGPLTYRSELPLAPGTLVRAPLGTREVLGIVWSAADGPPDGRSADGIRAIAGVLEGITPLSTPWRELVAFAAGALLHVDRAPLWSIFVAVAALCWQLAHLRWRLPPFSTLRAAPKKRFGFCNAFASTPPLNTFPEAGCTVL